MANTDLVKGYAGNYNVGRQMLDQKVCVKRYIDTTVTPLTSGGDYSVIGYPANTLITRAGLITETVEGAAKSVDLRDDDDATTTLCNDHDLNTDNAITNYSTGIFKASAGNLNILANAAITAAKFWVYVEYTVMSTKD